MNAVKKADLKDFIYFVLFYLFSRETYYIRVCVTCDILIVIIYAVLPLGKNQCEMLQLLNMN